MNGVRGVRLLFPSAPLLMSSIFMRIMQREDESKETTTKKKTQTNRKTEQTKRCDKKIMKKKIRKANKKVSI